jgi:hypothetical protein
LTATDPERTIEFEFVRATENAALNVVSWLGRGEKEKAAACELNLEGNNGDIGKEQADLNAGILTPAQADALLYWGNILLLGVTRR